MRTYKEFYDYVQEKRKSDKNYYCSNEYKKLYPIMIDLYDKEGLKEKRKNKINNKKRLNKVYKEHGAAVMFL